MLEKIEKMYKYRENYKISRNFAEIAAFREIYPFPGRCHGREALYLDITQHLAALYNYQILAHSTFSYTNPRNKCGDIELPVIVVDILRLA